MTLWSKIKKGLPPEQRKRYKSDHIYSVALSNKLTRMAANGLIKKEGERYGIPKSPDKTALDAEKPEEHVREIANGLAALLGVGTYRMEGRPYPEKEYMEPCLQHIKTGYPRIFQAVVKMARWRPTYLKYKLKSKKPTQKEDTPSAQERKEEERVERNYNQAKKAFDKQANLLARRLQNGIDKLETSYCKICEGMHGKTVSAEDERQIRELLRIVWNVTE